MEGYNEVRKTSEEEKKSIKVLSQGAALRFLLTRVFDYINIVDGAVVFLLKYSHMNYIFSDKGFGLNLGYGHLPIFGKDDDIIDIGTVGYVFIPAE